MKRALTPLGAIGRARGITVLTYHRVGGGTGDELDTPLAAFEEHLDALLASGRPVVSLDEAVERLDGGDDEACVVLTFDDGFADVHRHAWPRLRERDLPFTVYVAAGLIGAAMAWEGSSAASQGSPALTWDELEEMVDSGLCTAGNHTFSHVTPDRLTADELDRCSDLVEARLGRRPRHFAYTWGVEVPRLRSTLAARFRTVATGRVGRNHPSTDRLALRRVPVRSSDPIAFFRAKVTGGLLPELAYDRLVRTYKRVARG